MNELAYTYDFLSMVFEDRHIKEKISDVVLFGSVAKKTSDKESDIDLFFNLKNSKESDNLEISLKKILKSFEVKSEKTWGLKKIHFPISLLVGSLSDETWKDIREEIVSSGIALYGSYKELPSQIKHNSLFSYSLKDLNRKNKMKFIRNMFGYTLKRGKKEYSQQGILEKINGVKLASNVILVPSESTKEIKDFFRESKVGYKIMETWVRL